MHNPRHHRFIFDLVNSKDVTTDDFLSFLNSIIDANDFDLTKFPSNAPDINFQNLLIETPYKTSYTYSRHINSAHNRTYHPNFDADLTILAGSISIYSFRPITSVISPISFDLHSFLRKHNQRHYLSTEEEYHYVLKMSGELVLIQKNLLPAFGGIPSLFDRSRFPEPWKSHLGPTLMTPKELFPFNPSIFVEPIRHQFPEHGL